LWLLVDALPRAHVVILPWGGDLPPRHRQATALGYKNTSDAIKQHCKGGAIYTHLQTNGGVHAAF